VLTLLLVAYTIFVSAWIYPVVVHWVWSVNGWLSYFQYPGGDQGGNGKGWHLFRSGMIDYAGSGEDGCMCALKNCSSTPCDLVPVCRNFPVPLMGVP